MYKPTVVAIIGSSRFKKEHLGAAQRFSLQGKIVLLAGFWHHVDAVPINDEDKQMLDHMMMEKISMADEVFVVNIHGYIGSSTKRGIVFAKELRKPVTYLETPIEA